MLNRIHIIGSGRVGSAVSARLAERGFALGADDPELVLLCVPDGAIAEVAATVEPGPWVAHVERRDAARRARTARAPLQRASAADVHGLARRRAARRRVGRRHRGDARRARDRAVARGDARPEAVRARRLGPHALPRRRGVRIELHRDAAARGIAPLRVCGRAAGSARAADAAHDRERLRADGADLPRRLGHRRSDIAQRSASIGPSSTISTRPSPARRWRSRHEDRADDRRARSSRGTVGLVPTMGALARRPSLALPRRAQRERARRRVASSSTPRNSATQPTSPHTRATRRATPRSQSRKASTSCSRRARPRSTRRLRNLGRRRGHAAPKAPLAPVTSAPSRPSASSSSTSSDPSARTSARRTRSRRP